MKALAIIPARSGSKGLKNKNILPLLGKPLLAYSVEAALHSRCFDTVMVSTDTQKYAEIATVSGAAVPFLRGASTSTGQASSWDMVLEVLEGYERMGQRFDTVVLLQPTSPLRNAQDIQQTFFIQQQNQAKTVVSVCEIEHSPLWCNTLPENHCMKGFIQFKEALPRQQLGTFYRINGAIYLISVETLKRNGTLLYDETCYAYPMTKERSVDIDDSFDFMMAEFLLKNQEKLSR